MARDNVRADGAVNPSKYTLKYRSKYMNATVVVGGKTKEVKTIEGGEYAFYDVVTKEKGEFDLPIKFVLLDESPVCFSGFNEPMKMGVYSNMVASKDAVIDVMQGSEKLYSFTLNQYAGNADGVKDVTLSEKTKAMVKSCNAKYTACVFAMMNIENVNTIVTIQISGAALTGGDYDPNNKNGDSDGWFTFLKQNFKSRYNKWIRVESIKEKNKGSSDFSIPVYEMGDTLTQEDQNAADECMAELRPFLNYISGKHDAVEVVAPPSQYAGNGIDPARYKDAPVAELSIPSMPDDFIPPSMKDIPPDGIFANDDDLPF